ncbi:MAG: hypothetical protein ACRDG6_08635 [Candidatus Limnocylindria bacterium]
MDNPANPASRTNLPDLLERWRSGVIGERAVHEEAERSIAFEVVSQLEILNVQLITAEDVPAFIEFLETPSGAEGAGWDRWQHYWDGIDFAKRLKDLVNNPYYAKRASPSDVREKH